MIKIIIETKDDTFEGYQTQQIGITESITDKNFIYLEVNSDSSEGFHFHLDARELIKALKNFVDEQI